MKPYIKIKKQDDIPDAISYYKKYGYKLFDDINIDDIIYGDGLYIYINKCRAIDYTYYFSDIQDTLFPNKTTMNIIDKENKKIESELYFSDNRENIVRLNSNLTKARDNIERIGANLGELFDNIDNIISELNTSYDNGDYENIKKLLSDYDLFQSKFNKFTETKLSDLSKEEPKEEDKKDIDDLFKF